MTGTTFNKHDLEDIRSRGIPPDQASDQIEIFKRGLPFIRLLRPCTVEEGITALDDQDIKRLSRIYEKACLSGRAVKFVPASGAASRMFKLLLNKKDDYLNGSAKKNPDYERFLMFFEEIERFPFYEKLASVMSKKGLDIKKAFSEKDYRTILDYVLYPEGLNLAHLPKALIPFHRYADHSRTPIEEHIVEGGAYVRDAEGIAGIHFTVSSEQQNDMVKHIRDIRGKYERSGLKYELSISNQKSSTDTIAVDMENNPIRDREGKPLFRPGGHGALLENLSDLKGDIVFIKNIDNVVHDRLKQTTYKYKKALGGFLIELQEKIFMYLKTLLRHEADTDFVGEVFHFMESTLSLVPPAGIKEATREKKLEYLLSRLNRPVRVCGMVRNVSEPGGGPFWVRHSDGTASIQIVESAQADMSSKDQKAVFESSTHFNPVDLVCGMRDHSGEPFDLKNYVDHEAGIITTKSTDGKELKALELPGLWNGSMAYWNSVFIEVPLITFNPVKTIFDLLRKEHQAE
jgi:hypothetical protein